MVDIVSPAKRSKMMAGIRSKNTRPEIEIRKLLHRMGYRFRLHRKDLPGSPDIVLPRYKTVVFVNGCFWHGHANCPLFRPSKSRKEFWDDKIHKNRTRDLKKSSELQSMGWCVVTVWECATKGRPALTEPELVMKLKNAISGSDFESTIRGEESEQTYE